MDSPPSVTLVASQYKRMYQQNLLNKNDDKHCPFCNHLLPRDWHREKKKAYGYELTRELAEIAVEIWRWCWNNKRMKFLSKEVSQDHVFLTQFQKLQYFGIIQKVRKSMYWRFTLAGYWFLKETKSLPKKVWVVKSQVTDTEPEMITIDKVIPDWKVYSSDWQQDYILVPYVEVLKIAQ